MNLLSDHSPTIYGMLLPFYMVAIVYVLIQGKLSDHKVRCVTATYVYVMCNILTGWLVKTKFQVVVAWLNIGRL